MGRAALILLLTFATPGVVAGTNVWTASGPAGGTVWDITVHPNTPSTLFAGTEGGLFKSTDSGASWSIVASAPGGTTVSAVRFAPSNASVAYLGTSTVGIWKSLDGGATWSAQSQNISSGQSIRSIAIHPTDPSIVYAGARGRVYRSTDGDGTWSSATTAQNATAYALAIDPRATATVYAATTGAADGVYRSTDSGLTWAAVNTGLITSESSYGVYDVTIDGSTNPSTVYIASAASGVAKSTTGTSWTQIRSNVDGGGSFTKAYSISVSASSPSTLYAGGENVLYKSTDRGSTWASLSVPANTGSFFSETEIDPTNGSNVYTASNTDVLRSTTAGSSWTVVSTLPAFAIESLALHSASGHLFAGTYEYLFRSTDHGASWTRIARYPQFAVNDIKVKGDVIYAWLQPIGCMSEHPVGQSLLIKSVDAGATWTTAYQSPATSARKLAIDPQDANTVYATSRLVIGKSVNGGASFATITGTVDTSDDAPIIVHPVNRSIVFYGGKDGVYKSADGGSTWALKDSGIEFFSSYGISSLTIDPSNPDHVFAGSLTALFESTDAGENWTPVFPFDMETSTEFDELWPTSIVVDPANASHIYLATRKYGVFRTTDGGASWSDFNSGLFDPRLRRMIAGNAGRFHAASSGSGVANIDTAAPLPAPVLTATASGTSRVDVAWSSVGATTYQVERSVDNASFVAIATGVSAVSYPDNSVTANNTYFYRVVPSGGASSNVDFAVTVAFTDEPLAAATTIVRARHLTEIRTGIDSLRAALARSPASWTASGSSAAGQVIRGSHISELRTWLSDTLTAFGRSISYTDSVSSGGRIKAVHMQELRNALK